MSRIVTRNLRISKNKDFQISSRFSKVVFEDGIISKSVEVDNLKSKLKAEKNKESSRNELLKLRASSKTSSYGYFNTGFLPPLQTVLWIPKRWKQCQAEAVLCPKMPVELGSSKLVQIDPCYKQPKVIIIGAGMAGLSAAFKLAQSGFRNFKIFEATDRIGGRIHSCWLGDVVGELGANWLNYGTIANPLYSLAAQEDLLKDPIPWRKNAPLSKIPYLASDGRAIEPSVTVPAAKLFKKLEHKAFSLFSMDDGKSPGSLLDFFKQRLEEEMKAVPPDWRAEVSRVVWGLFNEYKSKFGAGACQLSTEMYGSSVTLPGNSLRVPIGMSGLLAPLLQGIDPQCISYCTPVEGITWQGGQPRATVRLKGGNVQTADYVIVTMSLGVLKSNWEKLFTPCLPDAKMEAINKLGFGTINNFILKYAKPFWLPGEGLIRFSWTEKELGVKESWVKGISLIEDVPCTNNILTFRLGGEEAMMTELCAEEAVAEGITKLLRKFSGDSSLPYPTGILRSCWGSDPSFRGSRSYLSVGSTIKNQCDLASPLPGPDMPGIPIVLFAGEATAPGYSGGLLGAHLSGLREADRILGLTNKYRGLPPEEPCR